jgi:hypothetical protein
MAAKELAQYAFAAVAHNGPADGARSCDTEPGWPVVVAFARPKQKPPGVETPSALAGDIEIGAAPDALRRSKTKAALRGIRQR